MDKKYYSVFAQLSGVLPRAEVFIAESNDEAEQKMKNLLGKETVDRFPYLNIKTKEITKREYWLEKNQQIEKEKKESIKEKDNEKFRKWHESRFRKIR